MDPRSESLPPRAEALLSQSDWVRKLVRGVGVDEASAEDVLQSTWLAALKSPPATVDEGAGLRAWLSRVARNFALKRLVRDDARAARERAGAKEERLPSAADVVEREEARAQVVRALLDVPEPYRTTLLLRFYESLEPRDIARLQQLPGSTVRNRLRRGLELLRERLERDMGPGWKQRCVLVLPLLRGAPPIPAGTSSPAGGNGGSSGSTNWIPKNGTTGGGLVVEKIGLAAAAVLAAGGLVLTWTYTRAEPAAESSASSSLSSELDSTIGAGSETASASSASPELVRAEGPAVRERASSASPEASTSSDGGVRCDLRGRLFGPDGQPLKSASQTFRYRAALGALVEKRLTGGETAGPMPPGVVFFGGEGAGAGHFTEVQTELEVLDLALDAGPESATPVEGISVTEERADVLLEGAQVVEGHFADRTIGFETEYVPDMGVPPRIVVSNDAGEVFEAFTDGEGAFQIAGLRPARWHVLAEAGGCIAKRIELEIRSGEREKSIDIGLDAVIRLPVKLVTPDGKDLRDAVLADGELTEAFQPVPFARRACPNERMRDLGDEPSRRYGSGRWERLPDLAREGSGGVSGILEISDPLPLFVGVSSCGFVLDSKLVGPGTDEVVFVSPPERIRDLVASVSMRVHSAEDGRPIEGASASIESTPELERDGSGGFQAAVVPPGRRKLVLEAEGYERREEWIEIPPGARMDLGVRSLARPVAISGKIVDESGSPLSLHVDLESLDRRMPGAPLLSAGRPESAPDGTFEFLGAGPGRYLLSNAEGDSPFTPVEVDTRRGPVKDLVLVARPSETIRVMPPFEPPPESYFLVETPEGIPVQVVLSEGWSSFDVLQGVVQGTVKLVVGSEVLWQRPLGAPPTEPR